ncbi:MAG: 30S ribosomal protein S8e [Candidatus Hodarchaeales archaeon]|jgi:small subunit ribosomal protein S8e
MVQWHGRSRRKPTGGRYRHFRKKKKRELGRPSAETLVGETRKKAIRTRGGNRKYRLLRANKAVVSDGSGKTTLVEIVDVKDNPANKDFARRKIITKGAIIETPLGDARVTGRPGQTGTVEALLL